MPKNYYPEIKRTNHLFLLLLTIGVYAFTMISFLFYQSSFDVNWFHTAYVSNAVGIVLAAWVSIPRLVHFLNYSEEKIAPGLYWEPVLAVTSLIPFLFTFIVHCDQWNAAQPFIGKSVQLILLSMALLIGAAVAGIITGFRAYPRLQHFKFNGKHSVHLPFQ